MKKFVALLLAAVCVMALSVAAFAEAPKVTVGGEGNIGYNFTDKTTGKPGAEVKNGADFSDWNVKFTVEASDKVSFFAKMKSQDILKENFITDELTGTVKLTDGISVKAGYFGFGFGGSKDILDMPMGDLKSKAGIQVESKLMDNLIGKLYYAPGAKDPVNDTQNGAIGARLDYSNDFYGVGFIYGQSDLDLKPAVNKGATTAEDKTFYPYKNATAYTLTAFVKPMKDLKTFVDYSVKNLKLSSEKASANDTKNLKDDPSNTSIIVGALFTPAELPFEMRVEYDLDNKNDTIVQTKDFSPWGIRLDYKLNPNAKIELNRNQKALGSQETSLKLNISF